MLSKTDRLRIIKRVAEKQQREKLLLSDFIQQEAYNKISDNYKSIDKRLLRNDITINMKIR